MKTTEIFIEQVIIGFLVVLIAASPFYPEVLDYLGRIKRLQNFISIAAGVVGAAYLLGILFDRLADSLLADLEQHHRLRYALFKRGAGLWSDPWPEARLRIGLLRASGAAVQYYDYLRSRIRLSRALAVFLPGLTFAGVLALARPVVEPSQGAWLLAVVPVAYLLALLGWRTDPPKTYDLDAVGRYRDARSGGPRDEAAALRPVLDAVRRYRDARSGCPHDDAAARRRVEELERIHQELTALLQDLGHDRGAALQARVDRRIRELARRLNQLRRRRQSSRALISDIVDDPGVRMALVLAALALSVALWAGSALAVAAALIGSALAALAGWTWWRVSETQMALLADFERHAAVAR